MILFQKSTFPITIIQYIHKNIQNKIPKIVRLEGEKDIKSVFSSTHIKLDYGNNAYN